MASIAHDPGGRKRIVFILGNKHQSLRLGKVSEKQAQGVKVQIERLVNTKITGIMDDEASRWVQDRDELMHSRLVAVGLVKPREASKLGSWLGKYMDGRTDLKPKSRAALEDTRDKLVAHFGTDRPMRSISADELAEWQAKLVRGGLSEASAKHHGGNAKGFFADAKRRSVLASNPAEHLRSGATAASNERYVTPDDAEKIIKACPDLRWKLLFGLARYAGLRVPSESHLLAWGDVDWERSRLDVRSPKTEHHAGHERRWVPIRPELMVLLQVAFDAAPEGQEQIITLRGNGYIWKTMAAIIVWAKVKPSRLQQ